MNRSDTELTEAALTRPEQDSSSSDPAPTEGRTLTTTRRTPSDPSDEADVRSGLRPPQFRLRTLLAGVALLCALLAVAKLLSPAAVLVLIVIVLSIVAHVAGNALGTQLRDRGNRRLNSASSPSPHQPPTLTQEHFAPPSKLSSRYSLGLIVVPFIVVGSIGAAVGGGFWLANTVREKATLANMSLGVGAFAVIGGILGFLSGTFLKVMITANVEAWNNPDP